MACWCSKHSKNTEAVYDGVAIVAYTLIEESCFFGGEGGNYWIGYMISRLSASMTSMSQLFLLSKATSSTWICYWLNNWSGDS